jgi:hypothetical protein
MPTESVISGDSAGSQYAAQLATMITSPTLRRAGRTYTSNITTSSAGVVLTGGIYDASAYT